MAEVAETVGALIIHYDRAVQLTQCKLKTPGLFAVKEMEHEFLCQQG